MHDTCLRYRLLPDRAHRIRQALEAVADQHAHAGDATVLDLGQDPQPELGALPVAVLAGPQARDVALAVRGDAQGQADGAAGDLALADLHVDGAGEDHRVYRVQWPTLPFCQAVRHPAGDRGDGLPGDPGAVDPGQVRGDFPAGQPFRGQGNDHLVDPGQPPLPLGDDFRLEAGIGSRGTGISAGPVSVSTVLARWPLREL